MAKLQAYALQHAGLDTIEAKHAAGFETDCRDFGLPVALPEWGWLRTHRLHKIRHVFAFWLAGLLSSSSARIETPRLQACTPCTTQSFRTSMISSIVAPAFNAFLM